MSRRPDISAIGMQIYCRLKEEGASFLHIAIPFIQYLSLA